MLSKKFYLCGCLQNARTQHTLKVINYQVFKTLSKSKDFDKVYSQDIKGGGFSFFLLY